MLWRQGRPSAGKIRSYAIIAVHVEIASCAAQGKPVARPCRATVASIRHQKARGDMTDAIPYPKFQHHRPYRPWQVHALRPRSGDDRHRGAVAICRPSCSTAWTSSANAASPSKARPFASTIPPMMARRTSSTSSTPLVTSTSLTRSAAACAACEGAVLVVDATQGVEAQTVANAMMAMNANLEIIPLINKIDLPSGRARTRQGRDRGRPCHPGRRRGAGKRQNRCGRP